MDDIIRMIDRELMRANDKFPLFASEHEGYAVLLEEVEECGEEFSEIKDWIYNLWLEVRHSKDYACRDNSVDVIKKHAINLIQEAIQVAAMCDKFKLSLKVNERKVKR